MSRVAYVNGTYRPHADATVHIEDRGFHKCCWYQREFECKPGPDRVVLRFGAVGAVAFWLSRSPVLPRDVTLVSLVGFVVVLLFLEPLFLKQGRAQER